MQHFEQELEAFKQELLGMAVKAKASVDKAIRALVERNEALAREVEQEDDTLDRLEMMLDDRAIHLLSMAPVATQLRLITVAMKFVQNLERIGDEATTMARRSIDLGQEQQLKPYVDIPRMAQMALRMVDDALEAFVNRDPGLAASVIPRDRQVDELNRQLHRELSSYMVESPKTISRCLNLMVISKSLERIADHASNLAEEVVYLYEGRDVRHSGAKGQPGAPAPTSPSAVDAAPS